MDTPEFTVARDIYGECVKFVMNDLESAVMLLKVKSMASGRVTAEVYLLPLSRDEINRNSKRVQNPGYE